VTLVPKVKLSVVMLAPIATPPAPFAPGPFKVAEFPSEILAVVIAPEVSDFMPTVEPASALMVKVVIVDVPRLRSSTDAVDPVPVAVTLTVAALAPVLSISPTTLKVPPPDAVAVRLVKAPAAVVAVPKESPVLLA